MPYDLNQLLRLSASELDALFARSECGPIPNGVANGLAIAGVAGRAWQGKVFDARRRTLRSRIPGLGKIEAEIKEEPSLFDDKPCIVLDYSTEHVRDEIRLIAPDTYLGRVYWDGKPTPVWFALQFGQPVTHRWRTRFWAFAAILAAAVLLVAVPLAVRFLTNRPVTYGNIEEHFKYGSTGGYISAGFPYWIWRAMPVVFKDRLPQNGGKGYEAFGLVYEPGRDLPIGVQKGRSLGVDRVFFNCAACHHTTVRDSPGAKARLYLGSGAARFNIGAFFGFLFDIASDDRFNADNIVPEIERQAGRLSLLDRYVVYPVAIALMQQRLIWLRHRLSLLHPERIGPGRVDSFNPLKAIWGFPISALPERELYAAGDFPSIWNQAKKSGMQLHWDGNNTDVVERNKNAAFGTGTIPSTVDLEAIGRIERWLWTLEAPPYLYPIDRTLAARGATLYREYCAACHGVSGQDFAGALVGKVTDVKEIGTDRRRLDSFTYDLTVNLGLNYAGETYRFKSFVKTYGYANLPLDGLWLRAPYLHNGSVPTLRDLLEPSTERPKQFYRGYDVYDPVRIGFRGDVGDENGRKYFLFDTHLSGQGNQGHEGKAYGTELSPADKDALVEHLKTF